MGLRGAAAGISPPAALGGKSPSPCPLPQGERGTIMKSKRNFLPLDGGGKGGGDLGDFFKPSGGEFLKLFSKSILTAGNKKKSFP